MKNIHLLFAFAVLINYELPTSLAQEDNAPAVNANPSNTLNPVVSDLQSKLDNIHTQYLALRKQLEEEKTKDNAKDEAATSPPPSKNSNDNDGEIVLKLSSNLGTTQDADGKTRIISDSNSKIYGKNTHKYNVDVKRTADVRLKG